MHWLRGPGSRGESQQPVNAFRVKDASTGWLKSKIFNKIQQPIDGLILHITQNKHHSFKFIELRASLASIPPLFDVSIASNANS